MSSVSRKLLALDESRSRLRAGWSQGFLKAGGGRGRRGVWFVLFEQVLGVLNE